MAHVVLLLLVAGEDADLGKIGVHEVLEHGVAERAGATRDHQGLVFESAIHNRSIQLNRLDLVS